ncbi:DegT/DnrJ/EryC1/StrS family aminotransferase [Segetibacter aerophilus]|uniref:Aminotransferase n=1 Tax=Segetibacter aerophilus TaxID=670293 RepID=A0A512BAR2_9BACT|nr:DegT/DnrJ/EryC1/StrS family aminotransferase [Segetibacter aerophilus]GEO09033.1 aminotransferase [Segetibacter aerophilus]
MKIPFSPPFIDDDVKAEVMSALESGWITTGPKVKALEQETVKYAGIEQALCVNSATSGLMLVLHWLGIGKGDEVIIPAYTYCATALAVMHVGATPIMVDVKDDFNIDPEKVRAAITNKTKAVIPVDFAGWPCDYDTLFTVVNDKEVTSIFNPKGDKQEKLARIAIVSDAAHSFGAVYKNKKTGSLADFTVFSYHAVKNLTTAEGGAICITLPLPFDNAEVYRTLRLWCLNGQTKDAFSKSQVGGWRYDVVYAGFKMNMPDVCAAIGLAQIRKYTTSILAERKRVFEYFSSEFSKNTWAEIAPFNDDVSCCSYHLYPLRIRGVREEQRDQIIEKISLAEVAVNVHFIPLPMLTVFRELHYNIQHYPVSYQNYSCEISLPIYPQLDNKLCEHIVKVVRDAVKETIGQ